MQALLQNDLVTSTMIDTSVLTAGRMSGAGLVPGPSSSTGHAPGPGRRRYRQYHMQRLQTTANHVLFYLVDQEGQAHLAIVGTDVRLSGHFVYCSLPSFTDGPPLRCTNRTKVMEWLSQMGANECADPDDVKIPAISPQQLEMLLSSDPMFSKPQVDTEYVSWREEGGRFPDGRHFKNYYLIEAGTQREKLVITAEDSHRKDRRYAYKAVPDMGGFAFENGQAVREWLDFVVGRSPGGPLARPITKQRTTTSDSGVKGRKKTPSLRQHGWAAAPQIRPGTTASRGTSTPSMTTNLTTTTTHTNTNTNTNSQRTSSDQPAPSLSGLTFGSTRQQAADASTRPPPAPAMHGGLMHGGPFDHHGHPMQTDSDDLAWLTDSVIGRSYSHTSAASQAAALVAHAAALPPLKPGAPAAVAKGDAAGGADPRSPRRARSDCSAASVTVVGETAPEVAALFRGDVDVYAWVTGVPGVGEVARVQMWCKRLSAATSKTVDMQATEDALLALTELAKEKVTLRLLEATQASTVVFRARAHPDLRVAQAADSLTQAWRDTAIRTLTQAQQATPAHAAAPQAPAGMTDAEAAAAAQFATGYAAAATRGAGLGGTAPVVRSDATAGGVVFTGGPVPVSPRVGDVAMPLRTVTPVPSGSMMLIV